MLGERFVVCRVGPLNNKFFVFLHIVFAHLHFWKFLSARQGRGEEEKSGSRDFQNRELMICSRSARPQSSSAFHYQDRYNTQRMIFSLFFLVLSAPEVIWCGNMCVTSLSNRNWNWTENLVEHEKGKVRQESIDWRGWLVLWISEDAAKTIPPNTRINLSTRWERPEEKAIKIQINY